MNEHPARGANEHSVTLATHDTRDDRLFTRGHDVARGAIRRWIVSESPPHAVLLSGPPNVGKTTLAEDLAAGLLCLAADPADRPCRDCLACRKVARGIHPDVHSLVARGPGGQIRIAAARALSWELALLPAEGRRRVAIVEGAQRLNEDAQNALLKTLEEPPPGVTLVLCADDEDPVLPTVRSRCVRVTMPALAPRTIAGLLAERGVDDPARAARVARLAGGRPGVALAIAADPDLERALGRVARRLLDLTAADRRTRFAAAPELMADGALLASLEDGSATDGREPGPASTSAAEPAPDDAADRAAGNGSAGNGPSGPLVTAPLAAAPALRRQAFAGLVAAWRGVARDLAVVALGGRAEVRWVDLLDELERTSRSLDRAEIGRFLDTIERVGAMVEANANPELALDVLLLAWPRVRRPETQASPAR